MAATFSVKKTPSIFNGKPLFESLKKNPKNKKTFLKTDYTYLPDRPAVQIGLFLQISPHHYKEKTSKQ